MKTRCPVSSPGSRASGAERDVEEMAGVQAPWTLCSWDSSIEWKFIRAQQCDSGCKKAQEGVPYESTSYTLIVLLRLSILGNTGRRTRCPSGMIPFDSELLSGSALVPSLDFIEVWLKSWSTGIPPLLSRLFRHVHLFSAEQSWLRHFALDGQRQLGFLRSCLYSNRRL